MRREFGSQLGIGKGEILGRCVLGRELLKYFVLRLNQIPNQKQDDAGQTIGWPTQWVQPIGPTEHPVM